MSRALTDDLAPLVLELNDRGGSGPDQAIAAKLLNAKGFGRHFGGKVRAASVIDDWLMDLPMVVTWGDGYYEALSACKSLLTKSWNDANSTALADFFRDNLGVPAQVVVLKLQNEPTPGTELHRPERFGSVGDFLRARTAAAADDPPAHAAPSTAPVSAAAPGAADKPLPHQPDRMARPVAVDNSAAKEAGDRQSLDSAVDDLLNNCGAWA